MKITDIIGLISGILVFGSSIPYGFRVWQGIIITRLTSWFLWTLIGFAILATFKSAGAESNVWPAVFGFVNPILIMILSIKKKGKVEKPKNIEWGCLAVGLISLVMWIGLIVTGREELMVYALCVAIIADLCAAIPTLLWFLENPLGDRPFAWSMFAIGYGLALFAKTDPSPSDYILSLYMFFGASTAAAILIKYRIKKKIPLKEWI